MSRRAGARIALAGALLLGSCTWFDDDEAAGPERVLPVDAAVCGISFGPQTVDPLAHFTEVGLIDTAAGAIHLIRSLPLWGGPESEPDLVIDAVPVRVRPSEGRAEIFWPLDDSYVYVDAPDRYTGTLRGHLDELVVAADVEALAEAVTDVLDDAALVHAGPAPVYDVAVTAAGDAGGLLYLPARPLSSEELRARISFYEDARLHGRVWTADSEMHLAPLRADERSFAVGELTAVEEVSAEEFVDAIGELTTSPGRLAVTAGPVLFPRGCDEDEWPWREPNLEIEDAEVLEVEGGWSLRLDLSEPIQVRDEQIGLVVLGDVVLGASLPGDPGTHRSIDSFTVDAVLTEVEADYFAEVLVSEPPAS